MTGPEIDGVGPDDVLVRVVNEDRDDRVEPDALPVPARQQAGPDLGVYLMVDHDGGPVDLVELLLPAGLVIGDALAQLLVPVEESGPATSSRGSVNTVRPGPPGRSGLW